jgi:hypothetical protein
MDNEQLQHLKELHHSLQQRLHILELQSARFGIYTPPYILIEISDLKKEILSIKMQLKAQSCVSLAFEQQIISILFLSAEPNETVRLRLGEEFRNIQESLQLAKLRERFSLTQRMGIRPADISRALLDVEPQIVHFSGHGSSTGAICLEDRTGGIHPVTPDAMTALFEQFVNCLNCVVLNACYSEIQANAIARYINYVVGVSQAIPDDAAIAFTIGFYQAVGAGRTIEEAYKLGCVQIRLQSIPEYLMPILIKKS